MPQQKYKYIPNLLMQLEDDLQNFYKNEARKRDDNRIPDYANDLSAVEKSHLYDLQSYLHIIEYIKKNLAQAKNARNSDNIKKMYDECMYMQKILQSYQLYLGKKDTLSTDERIRLRLVTQCTKDLNSLLTGPLSKPEISGVIAFIGSFQIAEEDTQDAVDSHSDPLRIEEKEETSTDSENKKEPTSNLLPRVVQKPIICKNAITYKGKQTNYVTVHKNEKNSRVAIFQTNDNLKEAGKERTPVASSLFRSTTIPNDVALAWAIIQVENFLHDNPHSKNDLQLTGSLGNFSPAHVESIMLYAAYLKEKKKININIQNYTSVKVDISKEHIAGFSDRLSKAHTLEDSPLKNIKKILDDRTINPNLETIEHNEQSKALIDAKAKLIKQAEALYQQKLIAKAIDICKGNIGDLRFDPQGHVLIDVILDKNDYAELRQNINDAILTSFNLQPDISNELQQYFNDTTLETLLNLQPDRPTLCNIDIKEIPQLEDAFKAWLPQEAIPAINALMNSFSRSSVIPLQEEMELHMRLISRILQEKMGEHDNWDWDKVRNNAAKLINKEVAAQFYEAIKTSYDPKTNEINIATLNEKLDQAREIIAPKCRELLINSCLNLLPGFNAEYTQKYKSIDNKDFTKKTATGQDYLRTDNTNHISTRITGTDKTAHHKEEGIATRLVHRNVYKLENQNLIVKPLSKVNIEARVPSIAVKEWSHTEAVYAVKDVLAENYALLQKQLGGYEGPMVYNLLTSLHNRLWDRTPKIEAKNRQRASAARILKGAHLFNAEQVSNNKPNSLWYVQNIAVNQHTKNLNYHSWDGDSATSEATVMAEIAMLSTFNQQNANLSPALKSKIEETYQKVHAEYVNFLNNYKQGDRYFKDSEEGKRVIKLLVEFKGFLKSAAGLKEGDVSLPELNPKTELTTEENASLTELATKALIKMMATNQHWNKQYGMLVQSLSVFIEMASQTGCKSANERYQAVSGRVELLNNINEKTTSERSAEQNDIFKALQTFVNNPEISPADLQMTLDTAYNNHNLYGVATALSEEDQGASSKVERTASEEKGVITEWNTNKAETGYLSYLFQEKSGKMQAHKIELAEEIKAAFETQTGSKLKSSG